MTKAMDISNWQGVVSQKTFEKNRNKIPYVFIRCSYTATKAFNMHVDKSFADNVKNAYKANMAIGVYHYSQAINESEAIKEAKFVIKTIKPYKNMIKLPVAFDWEFGGRLNSAIARKLGKQRCKQICDAFCRTIRYAGYEPMVYANLSTLNGFIASDIYKYWKIWVAQYHSRCDYKHPYYMWQYTSSGKVSGISGRVDLNIMYNQKPKPKERYSGVLPKLPKRGWFSSGDKGQEVKRLQKFLNWYGDYGLSVDGEVGRKTIDAVKRYQGREKLTVDGAFGKDCLARAKTCMV